MTRLERRIHRLIEKAILEHGYVLRTLDQTAYGWIDNDSRDCCLAGAIGVGCGLTDGNFGLEDIAKASGIDCRILSELGVGFENRKMENYSEYSRLGDSLRERYVVNS